MSNTADTTCPSTCPWCEVYGTHDEDEIHEQSPLNAAEHARIEHQGNARALGYRLPAIG